MLMRELVKIKKHQNSKNTDKVLNMIHKEENEKVKLVLGSRKIEQLAVVGK
jgi:hypothetical protein